MRRLGLAFLFLLFSSCRVFEARSDAALPGLAILQGVTSGESTQIAVLHRTDSPPELRLRPKGAEPAIRSASSTTHTRPGSPWAVLHLRFDGLSPGATYELEARQEGKVLDRRELATLNPKEKRVTWAAVSCMDDAYEAEQAPMWKQLLGAEPRFLLFLGDNVYADRSGAAFLSRADGDQLWRRYAETRNRLALFRNPRLVPVFAVWDDHDYGQNNGDRTFAHRDEARRIFHAFFPQEEVAGFFHRGPGVASRFRAYGQRFVLMDGRSFRSPKGEKDETHWGREQEDWLARELRGKAVPTWLANGDQFFGAYHRFESYAGDHPESFRAMMARLKSLPGPLVLLSGDRHLTEMMKIEPHWLGYPTFEITTSAIHAKTFPDAWKDAPNPRQVAGVSGALNYLVVTSSAAGGAVEFEATAMGPDGRIHFRRREKVAPAKTRDVAS